MQRTPVCTSIQKHLPKPARCKMSFTFIHAVTYSPDVVVMTSLTSFTFHFLWHTVIAHTFFAIRIVRWVELCIVFFLLLSCEQSTPFSSNIVVVLLVSISVTQISSNVLQ